jgi:Ca2+-binding RTX toxin-like protein
VNEITVLDLRHGTASYHIETILFDDGFSANLPSYQSWINGTSGNDTPTATSGNDTIIGFAGNDTIDGLAGADAIHGGSGNDTINGGDGADLIHGGTGDDTINGGDGANVLYGGSGGDDFIIDLLSATNTIKDFNPGEGDVLQFDDMLFSGYDPMNDDLSEFLTFTNNGADSEMRLDQDGAGGTYAPELIALIQGLNNLDADDLLNTGAIAVA